MSNVFFGLEYNEGHNYCDDSMECSHGGFQTGVDKFDIMLLNIQSLSKKKLDYVIVEYLSYSMSFVCLAETWCTGPEVNSYVIPGYTLITHYDRTSFRGGGVAIWSRSGVAVEPLDLSGWSIDKSFEACGLKWFPDKQKTIYLFVCYFSMYGNFDTSINTLENMLAQVCDPRRSIILSGDFNTHSMSKRQEGQFCRLLSTYGLRPLVTEPTRVAAASSTTVDQIFVNFNTGNEKVCVMDNCISDHRTVMFSSGFTLTNSTDNTYYTRKRSYNQVSSTEFLNALEQEDWACVYAASDTNTKFRVFHARFLYYFDSFFPQIRCKVRNNVRAEWVTEEVRSSSAGLKDLFFFAKVIWGVQDSLPRGQESA